MIDIKLDPKGEKIKINGITYFVILNDTEFKYLGNLTARFGKNVPSNEEMAEMLNRPFASFSVLKDKVRKVK